MNKVVWQIPRLRQIELSVFTLGVILLISAGCTGEKGLKGEDAIGIDVVPPSVVLTQPAHGDTVSDTLVVKAACIDNVGISKVVFFLDGSDQVDDSTLAWDIEDPFEYTFYPAKMRLPLGLHSLAVRAHDLAGNTTTTPAILITYAGPRPTGVRYLTNIDNQRTDFGLWIFPDTSETGDSGYNVRFDAIAACRLKSVRACLDTLGGADSTNYNKSIRFSVWHSNGAYPTTEASSFELPSANLAIVPAWITVEFPDTVNLVRGESFHVLFDVVEPDSTTRMAIRTEYHEPYTNAINNHSGLWSARRNPPRWATIQEEYSEMGALEFWIEAEVQYPDGSTAVLKPTLGDTESFRQQVGPSR